MLIQLRLLVIFVLITCSRSETGILNDESVQLMLNDFKSVQQVYFPNLNQFITNLNLIIQNESLAKVCKESLIRLRSGIDLRQHWALSC